MREFLRKTAMRKLHKILLLLPAILSAATSNNYNDWKKPRIVKHNAKENPLTDVTNKPFDKGSIPEEHHGRRKKFIAKGKKTNSQLEICVAHRSQIEKSTAQSLIIIKLKTGSHIVLLIIVLVSSFTTKQNRIQRRNNVAQTIVKPGDMEINFKKRETRYLNALLLDNSNLAYAIQLVEKDRSIREEEILFDIPRVGVDRMDVELTAQLLEKLNLPGDATKRLFTSGNRQRELAESTNDEQEKNSSDKQRKPFTSQEVNNHKLEATISTVCQEILQQFQLQVDAQTNNLATTNVQDIDDANLNGEKHRAVLLGVCHFMPRLYLLLGPREEGKIYYFISSNMLREGYVVMDHFVEILGSNEIPMSAQNKRQY